MLHYDPSQKTGLSCASTSGLQVPTLSPPTLERIGPRREQDLRSVLLFHHVALQLPCPPGVSRSGENRGPPRESGSFPSYLGSHVQGDSWNFFDSPCLCYAIAGHGICSREFSSCALTWNSGYHCHAHPNTIAGAQMQHCQEIDARCPGEALGQEHASAVCHPHLLALACTLLQVPPGKTLPRV